MSRPSNAQGMPRRQALAIMSGAALSSAALSGLGLAEQAESSQRKIKLRRIDNMDIFTRDLARLVAFYSETLGLHFFLPYTAGQKWAAIDFGNLTVYIFQVDQGEHPPRRTVATSEYPGLASFAFEVDNLEAAMRALDGKVEWMRDKPEIWRHPSGTYYRYRSFYDPDGNMMYITEPHKVAA